MRLLISAFVTFMLPLVPSFASAQSWTQQGNIAAICPTGSAGPCARVTCGNDGQIYLGVSSPELRGSGRRNMEVPRYGTMWIEPNSASDNSMKFHFKGNTAEALRWFKAGSRFSLRSGSFNRVYSLRGSSKAIAAVEAACSRIALENTPAPDSFNGSYRRFPDEARQDVNAGAIVEGEFKLQAHTDLPGYDLRNGLTDPELKSLEAEECAALCLATKDCTAYTLNNGSGVVFSNYPRGGPGVCFLKHKPQQARGFRGAISGEMIGSWTLLRPPPTRGPSLTVRPDAAPISNESASAFSARMRAISKPMADSCRTERRRVEKLSEDMRFSFNKQSLRVGNELRVSWTGNTLKDRVPVWAMVSVDKPARFNGDGFFALGPKSANPFGISSGMGEQRALTALYARGSGRSGAISVLPLEAQTTKVTVRLVAYLRDCEQEVLLKEFTRTVDVSPGRANVVLPDQMPNGKLLHTVHVDEFDRIVHFNETRIRILHRNGSEILNRAGSGVSFSPTTRFLSAVHNGKLDIVDLVDGATVTTLDLGTLYWGLGDALVMTNVVPWGEVSLVSTLGAPLDIKRQLTGPSCCHASPEKTKVMVSLENASFGIWGTHGHFVGSLQAPGYRHAESPHGGYSSSKIGSKPLYQLVLASMGPVAPISLANGFDIPGGLITTFSSEDLSYSEIGIHRLFVKNERTGARLLERNLRWSTQTQRQRRYEEDVEFQLERLGVSLRSMVVGDIVVAERPKDIPDELSRDRNGEYVPPSRQLAAMMAGVVEPFQRELTAAGWSFDWSDITPSAEHGLECYHMDLNQVFDEWPRPLVVRTLDRLVRIPTSTGVVWLSQAWCTAGATLGSLRPTTALYIHDIAEGPPVGRADTFRDTALFFENAPVPLWNDHPFNAKADKDFVLLFAPEQARVGVYDRNKRDMVQTFVDLPDGDLMIDAHLTLDGKIFVQENIDGSFIFHRLSDKETVLFGRLVNGEITVWTEDFRYDATAEAASLVDLRFAGLFDQFSLDRFEIGIRQDGLAERVADGDTLSPVEAVSIPPAFEGTISAVNDTVVVEALLDRKRPAEKIEIYQEGVLTDVIDRTANKMTIEVNRMLGAQWVSVIARNDLGIASNDLTADLGLDARGRGALHGVLVGVDLYDDERLADLNYAKSDVGRIYETLNSETIGAESIKVLTKSNANALAIKEAIDALVDTIGPEDHGVLYFAGHGLQDDEGRFYFATPTTNLDDLKNTALPWSEVAKSLAKSEGKITILLDACHSGSADGRAFATNDDAVAGLSSIPANVTILSASKGRELSVESAAFGGGAFSAGIEQVLVARRATFDTNGNGQIERSEFFKGVSKAMSEMPDVKQTPWMTNTRLVGDYALF